MNDLISRQDVIDAVTKYCTEYDLRDLLADIEVLPSAKITTPIVDIRLDGKSLADVCMDEFVKMVRGEDR